MLFTGTVTGQEVKSYKYQFKGDLHEKSMATEGRSLVINYSIEELNLEAVENEHGIFYRVSIPGHTPAYATGKPELPVLSRIITIPEGADYKIRITDVKNTRLHPSSKKIKGILYPAQESETKSGTQRKKDFRIDREIYASKTIIPSDTVIIESLGSLRNNRLYNISIIPVRYNPRTNSIEVITSMKIEISNIAAGGNKSENAEEESVLFTVQNHWKNRY
ncbi:MAG: hypothetical protein HZB98_12450 [Bacteroidia bacterium]|nr:hypothetical protein [Bacteroidia bacterium]